MPCFIYVWIILKIRETPSTFRLAHVSSRNTYWQVAETPYITCEENSVATITQIIFTITGLPPSTKTGVRQQIKRTKCMYSELFIHSFIHSFILFSVNPIQATT
jgi:hypothetical protein